ncbi:copper resistance CopC family protein [Rothia uropygialis]|uniref:copper resistance CopC family protein n=1 Tax=Kocuria sp. 36 TaxID=1415402 RepID=UPI00101D9118|nr:copper resistance CopC family protein [Kocuria sp. 36]
MALIMKSTKNLENPTMRRRIAAVPATIALVIVALFMSGTAAQAHDQLVQTDPAQDGKVSTAPDHVTLTFSGNITKVHNGNKVIVTDSEGNTVSTGDATVEGKEVTQKVSSDAKDETYKVAWRVVSEDGHPIEGAFNFTVGQGGSGDQASATNEASAGPSDDSSSAEANDSDKKEQGSGLPVWVSAVIGAVIALAVLAVVVLLIARIRAKKNDERR